MQGDIGDRDVCCGGSERYKARNEQEGGAIHDGRLARRWAMLTSGQRHGIGSFGIVSAYTGTATTAVATQGCPHKLSRGGTRACRQLSHRTTQTSRTPARNVLASLSKRVAIAL